MAIVREFKEFISRGNVVDMAVGIIIGAAFGAISRSLVDDVLMPPIGLLLGGVDFSNLFVLLQQGATSGPYPSLAAAREAGAVVIAYGPFIQTIINFLIVAFAVFLLIKSVNRLKRKKEAEQEIVPAAPTTQECPFCFMTIPVKARRCPQCTSDLT